MDSRNGCNHPAIARIGRSPSLTLRVAPSQDADRPGVAASFIRERFAARYGARVRHFMPTLLQLEDGAGRLRGVVGVRPAANEPLFLERYLDCPIETEIARHSRCEPTRNRIVEVGNLAALGAGHARLLIVALTDALVASGFDWVVFTGTPELINSFHRLDLFPVLLGEADPARMGEDLSDWGSYYESHPQVVAGDIRSGHARLVSCGLYQRLGHRSLSEDAGGSDAAVA